MVARFIFANSDLRRFNCPSCFELVDHDWFDVWLLSPGGKPAPIIAPLFTMSKCPLCEMYSFWINGQLIHPHQSLPILLEAKVPVEIADWFHKAGATYFNAPEASVLYCLAALRETCGFLGSSKQNLASSLAYLVHNNLMPRTSYQILKQTLEKEDLLEGSQDYHDIFSKFRERQYAARNTATIIFESIIQMLK
jgi:hypothetical protein